MCKLVEDLKSRKRQVMCKLVEDLKSRLVEDLKSSIHSKCDHAGKCTKKGCNVPLTGAPSPYLLVDMDCRALGIPADSGRCDFLFVGCESTRGADWVVPLELKRGSPDATDIVKQLQAGAQFAQDRIPAQHESTFLPVAVYGGKLHSAQINKFKRSRILFHGKKYEIKLHHCKTPMKEILQKASAKR